MTSTKRVKVSLTIAGDLLKRADAIAKAERTTRSRVIERCMADSLGQSELFVKLFGNPMLRDAFAGALGRPGVVRQLAEAMGEQVGPEQLELFERSMKAAMATAAGEPPKARKGRK